MKYLLILIFGLASFKLFSFSPAFNYCRLGLSFFNEHIPIKMLSDSTDDQKAESGKDKKSILPPRNPFNDLDWSWFKEKNRLEKMFIAIGIVSLVLGVPLIVTGLINHFVPFVDVSTVGTTTNFVLIGVGSGLMATGLTFVLVGSIRFWYLRKGKDKKRLKAGFCLPGINFG